MHILLKRMKRIPIAQDRRPQGCGCRAYMDVFTACLEQRVSFSSILLVRLIKMFISKLYYSLCLSMIAVNLYAAEAMQSDTLALDTTILSNAACMQCHEKQNSTLKKDWQASEIGRAHV